MALRTDDDEMPADYFFHGWVGFKLFGPFDRDEFKSIILFLLRKKLYVC